MSDADPDTMWIPADDLDRLLEYVWMGCLAASTAKDSQEDIHDCPQCGNEHMLLDEAVYVDRQAKTLAFARRVLDGVVQGLPFEDAREAARSARGSKQ